ncbi:MAG: hypothetical protein EP305_00620 [Bacteroidetes bacterium]|nr:MAG: hypothetical protein EP305_00620 [Bacteroidota bacterium]
MQLNFNSLFSGLSDTSRVWIYTLERRLDATEENYLREQLQSFISQWAAHGKELTADADVVNSAFIVISADESKVSASGCSIDTQVHFLKALSKELGIDFFNRMIFYSTNGEDLIKKDLSSMADLPNELFFDPMIATLGELRREWVKPFLKSQLYQMVRI